MSAGILAAAELARLADELAEACATAERARRLVQELSLAGEKVTQEKNGAYFERNQLLVLLAHLAIAMGWKVGVGQHPASDTTWEADWRTILFVQLPTGQCCWHFHDVERELLKGLPQWTEAWDGHSTPTKYGRVLACALDLRMFPRQSTTPHVRTADTKAERKAFIDSLAQDGWLAANHETLVGMASEALASRPFPICGAVHPGGGPVCALGPNHEGAHAELDETTERAGVQWADPAKGPSGLSWTKWPVGNEKRCPSIAPAPYTAGQCEQYEGHGGDHHAHDLSWDADPVKQ